MRCRKIMRGGQCVSGSFHRHSSGCYYVQWYDNTEPDPKRRQKKIYRYNGEKMFSRSTARKLLAKMQSDYEAGIFNMDNYTGHQTDVVPFLELWIESIAPGLAPATEKGYRSYLRCHIMPYFKQRGIPLVHVRLAALTDLLNHLTRKGLSGKMKFNIMACLHAALDFAWRAEKIPSIPPFPHRHMYGIQQPEVRWLPSARQALVLDAIPAEHQPIFFWLKYHLRRPGEAMALHRDDYRPNYIGQDGEPIDVFVVRRSISARRVVERTKTSQIHLAPVVDAFRPYLNRALKTPIISPFLFTHKASRLPGKRYSHGVLGKILKTALAKCDEPPISLYAFVKHSGFSQLAVEQGYSDSELQLAGGHADIRSVKKYRALEMSARKRLLERKPAGKLVSLVKG